MIPKPQNMALCLLTVKQSIIVFMVTMMAACQTPSEELRSMPEEVQRHALAELGRDILVDALREVEVKSPISYISVTNARVSPIRETVQRATLFSSAVTRVVGHSLSGVIESSALVASFKDVEIVVTYKASNGSEIARQSFVIYKTCHPGGSQNFEIELERPDQTTDYSYVVLNATRAD